MYHIKAIEEFLETRFFPNSNRIYTKNTGLTSESSLQAYKRFFNYRYSKRYTNQCLMHQRALIFTVEVTADDTIRPYQRNTNVMQRNKEAVKEAFS